MRSSPPSSKQEPAARGGATASNGHREAERSAFERRENGHGTGEPVPAVALRDRDERERRLEEGRAHVLPLPVFGATMRREPEYERNGHTGTLLMRTPELRVVLEVMAPREELPAHVVLGPALLCVLEGELEICTESSSFRIGERDAVVLPPGERRSIRAVLETSFLLAIARD